MLKIKDETTKQDLSYMDCKFWDDFIIMDLVYWLRIDYSQNEITITDDTVHHYNVLANQRKSNKAFVRRIKKLNKGGYFDVKNQR